MKDENDAAGERNLVTGPVPNVNSASGLTEGSVGEVRAPIAITGEKAGGAATGTSPAGLTLGAKPDAAQSDNRTAMQMAKVQGIPEIGRDEQSKFTTWNPSFEVEKGSESIIQEIFNRLVLLRVPLHATPAPIHGEPCVSIDDLMHRIQNAIAAQTLLPASTSSLLSFWALSTWFNDALPIAPGLVITGPAFEADLVLRTLRSFCRCPFLLPRADTSILETTLRLGVTPTLLFFDPNISKRMATIFGCSTSRGYLVEFDGRHVDLYGPKAIYLGEQAPADRMPHCSLQVHLHRATKAGSMIAPFLGSTAQAFQNELLGYRLKNLATVCDAKFQAPAFASDIGAIVRALGACIVDSPQLESELISLFGGIADQQRADRSSSPEAIALEAALNLAHAGKARIFVKEIATEANRLNRARGERVEYSAETMGRRLKKAGLPTHQLSKEGNGLEMDSLTTARLHQLAAEYGVVSDQDERNLHCPFCAENK